MSMLFIFSSSWFVFSKGNWHGKLELYWCLFLTSVLLQDECHAYNISYQTSKVKDDIDWIERFPCRFCPLAFALNICPFTELQLCNSAWALWFLKGFKDTMLSYMVWELCHFFWNTSITLNWKICSLRCSGKQRVLKMIKKIWILNYITVTFLWQYCCQPILMISHLNKRIFLM